jgi:ubiquinone/menaquinone biosynthesis C-methylase UbiE
MLGCDLSYGMLRHARAHPEPVSWVRADAQCLPFRDGSADAIVSTEAFHWFPDKARVLAECFRVLAPGGRLLVALVNTPNDAVRTACRLVSRAVGQPFDWPTRAAMRELLEGAGFRVETQQRVFRIPAGLLLPPVLTIGRRPV